MTAYSFDKSFQARLEEIEIVLDDGMKTTPLRKLWSEFLESSIEPAGYSAIYKISRANCESLKIKYPCEVLMTFILP